ncbi:hypothetical protein OGATHE_002265 [Ogataea polymorpha]|uniref:Uncharacterized protein n=1 Tax=Ogataea polymorpha TaxID=460523 RepID=A0A9P8TBP4_9ASCO|nr:hypothetical protein OGATHE_002265 [Ogataea polymorpha]
MLARPKPNMTATLKQIFLVCPATQLPTHAYTIANGATMVLIMYIPTRSPAWLDFGRKESRAPPQTAGTQRIMIASPLGNPFIMKKVERSVEAIETTPDGMFKSAACFEVNPNERMSTEENVVIVLEENEIVQAIMKNRVQREAEVGRKSHEKIAEANHKKHDFPPFERRRRGNLLKNKRNESSDNLTRSQTTVPESSSESCLAPGVPRRGDKNQTRCNGGFRAAQKNSHSNHTSKIRRCAAAHAKHTPYHDVDGQNPCGRDFLDEEALYWLKNKETNKKIRCKVGKLVTDEAKVFSQTHYIGVI